MLALTPHLQISSLSFRYPGQVRPVLQIEHLTIGAGERVALIGATGAGKSTLLKLIDGRLTGWSGRADVLSRPLTASAKPLREQRAAVGFVFQDYALIERASVFANVRNGRLGRTNSMKSLFGIFNSEDNEAIAGAIRDVGLEDLAGQRVDKLSGGQRQRVAVARCLAQNPKIVLADEPVSSLDPVSAAHVLDLLRSCTKSRGASLIISSHRPKLIARYVDRIVAMKQGRIVFDGPATKIADDDLAFIYDETKVMQTAA